jgi:hypothetical protein
MILIVCVTSVFCCFYPAHCHSYCHSGGSPIVSDSTEAFLLLPLLHYCCHSSVTTTTAGSVIAGASTGSPTVPTANGATAAGVSLSAPNHCCCPWHHLFPSAFFLLLLSFSTNDEKQTWAVKDPSPNRNLY